MNVDAINRGEQEKISALDEAKWALEAVKAGDWGEVSDNINQCESKLTGDEEGDVKHEISEIITEIKKSVDQAPDHLKQMINDRITSIEGKVS